MVLKELLSTLVAQPWNFPGQHCYLSKVRKLKVLTEYFNHRTFFRKSMQDRNGKATENRTLCSPQVWDFYSVGTELIEREKHDLR